MPAPRRAILADIHEQKLDPNVEYKQMNKQGKFIHEYVTTTAEKSSAIEDKKVNLKNSENKDIFVQQKNDVKEEAVLLETTETLLETTETEKQKNEITNVVEKVEDNKSSKKKLKKKGN